MANNNADNIQVARPKSTAGCAFVGGTAVTSASAALTGENLGWLHEDGIELTIGKDSKDIIAFGGSSVMTIQTSHDVELTLKALEFVNPVVLKAIFGEDNVTTGTGGKVESVKVNDSELENDVWTIDMRGQNGQLIRIVAPSAKPSGDIELAFKNDEPIAPSFTLNAFPDASGNKLYIYFGQAS